MSDTEPDVEDGPTVTETVTEPADGTGTTDEREQGATEPPEGESTTEPESPSDTYYENCDEAREAGAAPLFRGEPGYGAHLDRDDDGVACEWD
ncbi:excalibur calcium-binding domain-containing protein [Streptomyces sp. NPDC049813]|uniref:excalibur calcium-binding domain-containing protein n=1 Tax=Streptomyces sp. NPDC049813 TaxID=3365597 RepID=UPI0037B1F46A